MKGFIVALIRVYQYLFRPLLGSHCRFAPSCSEYAREAVVKHGVWRGTPPRVSPHRALSPVSSGRL